MNCETPPMQIGLYKGLGETMSETKMKQKCFMQWNMKSGYELVWNARFKVLRVMDYERISKATR